jgi:Na+/melibiose symporter-like transporter
MVNNSVLLTLFIIAVAFSVVSITAFVLLYLSVRKHVEEALKNATDKEQMEIRRQLVKVMFPPRFPRR